MRKPLIYLAAPYSHPEQAVVDKRMQVFSKATTALILQGHCVVSPLFNHFVIIQKHDVPGNWDFWADYSRELLARCDQIWVLKLPGWDASVGVAGEIEVAGERMIPIKFLEPEDYDV